MYGSRPTTRLLSMLELLQARARIGVPELARRLEVGERTVRRYASMLREMGIPVEAELGRHGAYVLRPGYRLPPMMFTEEEALALTLGLLAARGLGLDGAAPAVEGALAKLERVMPEALGERIRALQETVSIATGRSRVSARSEALMTLAFAAGERRRVRLRYLSGWSGETERAVDPYGVMHRDGRWYMAGHCHLRGGVRLFRVDRVRRGRVARRDVRATSVASSPRRSCLARRPSRRTRNGPSRCCSRPGRKMPAGGYRDGAGAGADGGRDAPACSTWDLGWVARELSGLECGFVVRAPDELKGALERRAAEISAQARRTRRGGFGRYALLRTASRTYPKRV